MDGLPDIRHAMKKWIVEYIEKGASKKRRTSLKGDKTREEVIEFFGLEGDEVEWYDVSEEKQLPHHVG